MRAKLLAAAFGSLLILATSATGQMLRQNETLLEVQSTGEAEAQPDRATISGGVTTTAETTRAAVAANSRAMTEVISALLAAGIPEADIRTASVGLSPQYGRSDPDDYSSRRIIGYAATNSVIVTVRNVNQVSQYLGAMFESGATNVSGPNFSIDDDTLVVAGARADAIAKARAEAESYAAGFGMRVARVIRVSERGRRNYYSGAYDEDDIAAPPPPPPPPAPGMSVPISIGRINQQMILWVDFALVPR